MAAYLPIRAFPDENEFWSIFNELLSGHYGVTKVCRLKAYVQKDGNGKTAGKNVLFAVDGEEFKKFAKPTNVSSDFTVCVGFCRVELRLRGETTPSPKYWTTKVMWEDEEDVDEVMDEDDEEDESLGIPVITA